NRRTFQDGSIVSSLGEYPDIGRRVARQSGAYLVDLNVLSKTLYEAFGPEGSAVLFKQEEDGSGQDMSHHGDFGAYELAKTVAAELQRLRVPLARQLKPGFHFDPARPDPLSTFTLPKDAKYTRQTPLGH